VTQAYDTQDRKPVVRSGGSAYVWRCARCGRFLARIDRLDGVLEVYRKCESNHGVLTSYRMTKGASGMHGRKP
jgi:hypothetical protein